MQDKEISKFRNALPQVIAVTVKNILLMSFGMTIGYQTILIPGLSNAESGGDISVDQEGLSWIASIHFMCVPIGCFFSGLITQRCGRKRTMQMVCVPLIVSWIIVKFASKSWQIYFALGLMGFTGGLSEAPVLTYVAEVTQPHLRGILSATSTMFVLLGSLIEFFMGAFLHWRTVALYNWIAPAAALVLLFIVPESPYWLIMKNRLDDARKSLAWLRGWTTVSAIEKEFQELSSVQKTHQLEVASSRQHSLIEPFAKRRFLHPLTFVSFVFFLAHFSGITALSTFAVPIFETLQVPMDKYYATILFGVSQFLGCLSCVTLVHFLGKRTLTFCTMILATICIATAATYAYLINVRYIGSTKEVHNVGDTKWISLVCLVLSAFMLQSGIRTLPWILVGEVFSKETRAFGAGLLAGIGYIFGFCINKIFLQTVAAITLPGTLWSFAATNLVGVIVLFFWLPETEGKTLLEITDHYGGKGKLDNKVRRKQNRELNGNLNEAFDLNLEDRIYTHYPNSRL